MILDPTLQGPNGESIDNDSGMERKDAFEKAAEAGHVAILSVLLDIGRMTVKRYHLSSAAYNGCLEALTRMLQIKEFKNDEYVNALVWAAYKSHVEIFKVLMRYTKPVSDYSRALQMARQIVPPGSSAIITLSTRPPPHAHNKLAAARSSSAQATAGERGGASDGKKNPTNERGTKVVGAPSS